MRAGCLPCEVDMCGTFVTVRNLALVLFAVLAIAVDGKGQLSKQIEAVESCRTSPLGSSLPEFRFEDLGHRHIPVEGRWDDGFTLILTRNRRPEDVNRAHDFVLEKGGRIAILLPGMMLGWVPPGLAEQIVGKFGIESVSYTPVDISQLTVSDETTVATGRFFNAVASGEIRREIEYGAQFQGSPLVGDALPSPFLPSRPSEERDRSDAVPQLSNTEIMTGTVAVAIFFIESNGATDENLYTWSSNDQQNTYNRALAGLTWWSNKATFYLRNVAFTPILFSASSSTTQQPYEPILHPSGDHPIWVNRIMANLGHTSGNSFERVAAYNAALRASQQKDWAFSAFIGYNPSPAPSAFTDGYFAFTWMGGPYIQMLFRNQNWGEENFWKVMAHETGHDFGACDEYYQPNYGGCESCGACWSDGPRPTVANGNCEFCNTNSVACMMKGNQDTLCSFTVDQIGWTGSGCGIGIGQGTTGGEAAALQEAYNSSGGAPILGCPTAAVRFDGFTSFAGTTGHYQFLSSGELIYHTSNSRAGQAFAMTGPFRTKWATFPFNSSHPLGYPIGSLSSAGAACDGTINRFQTFEGGSLVQHLSGSRNGQIFEVHGAIHRRWELSGFAGCPLGLPTSDETTAQPSGASGSTGKLNQFQGGQIYWKTGAAAAYQVHGAIYQAYVSLGGSASWLGFPVSNEFLSNGRARSDFEGGYITTLDGTTYQAFTYSGCPRSASASPTSGPVGTTVTITGDNFNGVGTVRFANNAAAAFVVNSSDRITATVPAGAGTGPITVVKGGCASVETGTFTVNTSQTPTLQFASASYSVGEGDGVAVITVTRSGGTGTLGVNYATSNGTATAGSDYTATSGVLSFAANETSKTFNIPITNDTTVEGNETVNLALTTPTGGAVLGSPNTAVLNITDNDSACTYSVSPTSANFTSSSGSGSFSVTAGAGCAWSASVNAPSLTDNLFNPIPVPGNFFETDQLAPQALFLNSASITVADRPASSSPGLGSLYPSSISVAGLSGSVSSIDVSINNITHPYPDDLDIILVGPGGQRSVLMSDAGGAPDLTNVNLTFAQNASTAIPDGTQIGSGTYRPANYAGLATLEPNGVDNFPSPGPGQSNFAADLSAFNGSAPNGTWRLYVVDDENLDTGMIAGGWALGITTAGGGTSWINITSGSSGVGNGTVNYSVASNTTGGARTGSITVAGQSHSVTQSGTGSVCAATAITIGPIFNGTLSTADCVLPGSTRYFDAYTFAGVQGQQVGINVTSSAFDTYVYLLNSAGTVLDEDDNSGPGTSSRIPASSGFFTLPSTGTYTIRATSAANGATGAYTVSIDRCSYALSTNEITIGPGNGGLGVLMDTLTGCNWSAVSDSTSWLTTTSAGPGDGRVDASYLANPTTSPRTGRITAGGQVLTVTQIGIGGAGTVQLAVAVQSVDEAAGIATIAVTRVGGTGTGSVQYTTEDGTATAGSDYTAASGTVLIVSDWTGTTFDVPILEDSLAEGPETFAVRIFNQSNSFFLGSPTTMTVTINDNESTVLAAKPFDFDGDGKSDISIFRPSNGQWWLSRSTAGVIAHTFGISTDTVVPADFTGDGSTDVAIWRGGEWFVLRSENYTFYSFPFGSGGDVPVPGDYDGDARADAAVFRPSNATWYIQRSSGGTTIEGFGAAGDRPVPADYDGDGKTDIAIYRPSLGQWWINRSTAGIIVHTFGNSADRNVPGDYTGDGKADVAIWRPSSGEWYVLRSEDFSFYSFPFGVSTDLPVPGDYDGDGKFDAGVFRPTNGTWYLSRSTAGTLIQGFGLGTDLPVPNSVVR